MYEYIVWILNITFQIFTMEASCHFWAECPWASHLTSLCLEFKSNYHKGLLRGLNKLTFVKLSEEACHILNAVLLSISNILKMSSSNFLVLVCMECLHNGIFVYDTEIFQGQLNFRVQNGSSKSSRKWNLMCTEYRTQPRYQIVLVRFISLVTVWCRKCSNPG